MGNSLHKCKLSAQRSDLILAIILQSHLQEAYEDATSQEPAELRMKSVANTKLGRFGYCAGYINERDIVAGRSEGVDKVQNIPSSR